MPPVSLDPIIDAEYLTAERLLNRVRLCLAEFDLAHPDEPALTRKISQLRFCGPCLPPGCCDYLTVEPLLGEDGRCGPGRIRAVIRWATCVPTCAGELTESDPKHVDHEQATILIMRAFGVIRRCLTGGCSGVVIVDDAKSCKGGCETFTLTVDMPVGATWDGC